MRREVGSDLIVAEGEKEPEKKIHENEQFKHIILASDCTKLCSTQKVEQMSRHLRKALKKVLKNIF